ncbi:peptidoglycan DD-metalloendopeptidase family protein [Mangrovivirga sp. M17]|uniref:Peptidoglycan DD-metalloendopeptidase family protein n=1 Tax=Mangrovivirga halotolerans TaxID=2993936 RepID=A0ABT3RU96_9BACT|nr:peptidoglycan DD-metalloendopeptidase family protein [Mangrovivirga halotolerans]MCX2744924.1 peptidoglycan DD-metalloendopeptidase family protein [Mangrovivirga halotolerans]
MKLYRLTGIIITGLIAVAAWFYFHNEKETITTVSNAETQIDSAEIYVEPEMFYGYYVDSIDVVEGIVESNQNLSEILSQFKINMQTIHELANKSKEIFDVRKIRANKKYTVIMPKDTAQSALAFIYEPNPIEYIVYSFNDSVDINKIEREIEVVQREISGVIENSLYISMTDQGASPALVDKLADVFGWQVDFWRIQKGDYYRVIYEENQVDGEVVGFNRVVAAELNHFGSDYHAVNFDQGDGEDYFDLEGNSLRKAFLRAPVEFSRITSRYTGRRFHPVQKRWKAHLGTDYAAPHGSPIRSTGDGIIVAATYSKYNGNYVKVKHNGTYTTQYLHMSKIKSGIRPGVRVRQGDVIGYIGSTGLATGPHVCYRFWKNGRQVDPMAQDLPPSEPIKEESLEAFNKTKNEYIRLLKAIKVNGRSEDNLVAQVESENKKL